jgi:carbon starvation protein CstA
VIFPDAIRRMKKNIQKVVQSIIMKDAKKGMKSILILFMIMIEAVFKTAMATARFFHKQQRAIKNAIPKAYST